MTSKQPSTKREKCDRHRSRTVLVGDQNFANVPLSWRNQLLIDMHSDRSLFSHQRAFVRSALDLEEGSLLAVLGFQDHRDEDEDEEDDSDYNVLPSDGHLRAANGHFYDSLDDPLVDSPRGITRLYLRDEQHLVLVTSVINSFGNNVQLLAEPINPRQNKLLSTGHRNDIINSSNDNAISDFETIERLIEPIYIRLKSSTFESGYSRTCDKGRADEETWKIVQFNVRSAFMDSCTEPVCRPDRVVDILRAELCSNDSCACCRKDREEQKQNASEKATLGFSETVCRRSNCWCVLARSNGDYQRGLNKNQPIDRRQRLTDRCLPRGYAQSFVRHWHNTGTFVAAFSLCMYNDTRNNWFVVPDLALDRFVDLAESFANCNYHVVRNLFDCNDFYVHYDYYSRTKNVIIIEEYLCFREPHPTIGPFRMFLYLWKPCPANQLIGRYNYIIYDYDLQHWPLYNSGQSYTTLSFVYSGVEQMFNLPNIDQIVHRANRYCSPNVYDPNLRMSSLADNEALLYTLFTDAYMRFDSLPRAHDPARWHAFRDQLDHLYEKVRKDNCVVCMTRTADYYVPSCCFNPICIICCARLDKLTCPMCRREFSDACLVPFILPDDEYTSSTTAADEDASTDALTDKPTTSTPLKRRFEKYCNPLAVLRRDLESLVQDVGFVVCPDGRYAFKVLIFDSDWEFSNEQLKVNGFYTYFMVNYSRRTAQYFKYCRMHAILVVRSYSCLRCNPMPFVTHVYFMNKPNLIDYRYVVYATHRYPRRVNLLINQFVQYPELPHDLLQSQSSAF